MAPTRNVFCGRLLLVALGIAAFALVPARANGDLAQEFEALTKEAEAGRTSSQYYLALRYLHGVGFPKDEAKAVEWFEKAAAGGDAASAFNLARLCKEGRVVPADPARAVRLFRVAVGEGVPGARVELGEMLLTGSGAARDFSEAATLFREAALTGNAAAAFNLGVMYARGWGVIQDAAEALRWYERAADGGEPNAQFNVASALLARSKAPDDTARAMRLLTQAAAQGVPAAMFTLGRIYEEGSIVAPSQATAIRWYRFAAESGHEGAMSNLARILIQRQLGPESDADAVHWLTTAAEKLEPSALFNLGALRERGIILPRDMAAAQDDYRQAAELGFGPAQMALAMLLLSSTHSHDEQVSAAAWGILAREQGVKLQGDNALDRLSDTILVEGRARAEVLRHDIERTRALREGGADVATVMLRRVRPPKASVNGACISPEGVIVAPYTPIAGVSEIKVRMAGALYPAAIIGVDEARDVAVLTISRKVEHWVARSTVDPSDGTQLQGLWYHAPWEVASEAPETTAMRPVVAATPFGPDREWLALDTVWDTAAIGGILLDESGAVGVLTGKRATGGSVEGVPDAGAQEHGVALRSTFIEDVVAAAGAKWAVADPQSLHNQSVAEALVIVLGF